ncbi:MAG: hypothetical protein KC593_26260, partial [Myxococcales bacterium]|nr:hypothetical protein [Myxococcales bacterium]
AGGYVVDDAFVVFRVAERFSAGQAWAFQGDAPADGVTAPLWGALLSVWARLAPAHSTALGARLMGSACVLLAGSLVLLRVGGPAADGAFASDPGGARDSERTRRYTALVLGVQLPLVVWAGAGLETGLATLVVALVSGGLLSDVGAGTTAPEELASAACGTGAGRGAPLLWLLLASVSWLRPELVPVALVAGWYAPRSGALRSPRVHAVCAVLLGTLGVIVMRIVVFGHPLPLAALAKPSDPLHGLRYVSQALLVSGAVSAVVVTWVLRVRLGTDAALRTTLSSFGPLPLRYAVGVGLLAVTLAGGDWMPAGRLLVPLLPLLAVCVGSALASLPAHRALAAVLTLALPLLTGLAALPGLRAQPRAREVGSREVLRALDGATRVALVDVGHLAYAGGFEVVDLGGITDLEIARLPGGHLSKRIPETLLRQRGVDAIVLHSSLPARVGPAPAGQGGALLGLAGYPVEVQVARMPFVQEEFRVRAQVAYAPDYHYVVLRRSP